MLASERIRELITGGFPARFHFRVELWSEGRWVNDLERRVEYEVFVRYLALEKLYDVTQMVNDRPLSLGRFARVEDAENAIARPTRVPITAISSKRRQYYQVTLDVEVLSVTDLDELNRWLRGELRPAIGGSRNPGTALTSGLRTLATRLLGGEKREYEKRTDPFRVP